jgi:hypothetical protein
MHDKDFTEQLTNRVRTEKALQSCRNHLESLPNLRYLTSLEVEYPQQVRLHLRRMDWHLRNLPDELLSP